jgi:hypothetical protein
MSRGVARPVAAIALTMFVAVTVAVGAVVLVRSGHLPRAVALVAGAALTWAAVWLVKALIGRPRPLHSCWWGSAGSTCARTT